MSFNVHPPVDRREGSASGDIVIASEAPDCADARLCLRTYFEELGQRFDFCASAGALARDGDYAPPAGVFLVARRAGEPVGCCALRLHQPGIGELKRLWVRRDARGHGIARRLLACIEIYARARGLSRLRLDTHGSLLEARALYCKHGYREIAAYNSNPDAEHWFEKRLADIE